MPDVLHQVAVDHSESRSSLLDAGRRSGRFEVRMVHLATGDYLIDDQVLIERKTVGDLRASLVDGRLFPQVARLAHSSYRSLLLIEGPAPTAVPDVHPHYIDREMAKRRRKPVRGRSLLKGGRKRVLVVLFVPSVERDGTTPIEQDRRVDAALEVFGACVWRGDRLRLVSRKSRRRPARRTRCLDRGVERSVANAFPFLCVC